MSLFKFIKSKLFLWQIAIAFVAVILLIMGVMWSLGFYTRHGRTIIVPKLVGFQEVEIGEALDNIGLNYSIIDSMHKNGVAPGEIVDQVPRPGQYVKKGRMIFLTINAFTRENVIMPKLVDYSLRNAQVVLESSGLVMGPVVYKPSEYADLVLGQIVDGRQIKPGSKIPKGTAVTLIVGSGLGNSTELVPDLIGLTIEEANASAMGAKFAIGSIVTDATVKTSADSALAVVWKQSPDAVDGSSERIGTAINIWVTNDMDAVMNGLTNSNE